MIYFFTGQPKAGKTILAKHLKSALSFRVFSDKKIFLVDEDDLKIIIQNKDFSEQGERANISQAIGIAKYLHNLGYDVIICLVCPYKDLRDEFKSSNNVKEIYVHTTEIREKESFNVSEYQPPTENFIDIDTTGVDEFTSLNELLNKLNT